MDKTFYVFYKRLTPDMAKCLSCKHCKCIADWGWQAKFKCEDKEPCCNYESNEVTPKIAVAAPNMVIVDPRGDMTPEEFQAEINYRLKTGRYC